MKTNKEDNLLTLQMSQPNNDCIYINGYNPCSVVDGDGLREVWYISGCTHKCNGCQNEAYWNISGVNMKISDVVYKMALNSITNITISGGDGLTIQYDKTLELLKAVKKQTKKNIWLYTGYTYEELLELNKSEVLNYIDVLVDGKFEYDKRDITLSYRGSSNQRIIDVNKTLNEGKIVIYDI